MKSIIVASFWLLCLYSCQMGNSKQKMNPSNMNSEAKIVNPKLDTCVLAGGCFWCLDAVYRQMKGVISVTSGYSNGKIANPTYREVCSGLTGCAEVVKIVFDQNQTSFQEILTVFWRVHDPTTLNKQGNDEGTQYRSGIYYLNLEQKAIAQASLSAAAEAHLWPNPIVTEILPLEKYSDAEDYHQNYYEYNPDQPYCIFVVGKKVDTFKKLFAEKLKQH